MIREIKLIANNFKIDDNVGQGAVPDVSGCKMAVRWAGFILLPKCSQSISTNLIIYNLLDWKQEMGMFLGSVTSRTFLWVSIRTCRTT